MANALVHLISPADNVAVSLTTLKLHDFVRLEDRQLYVAENIPLGHKIALTDIPAGAPVVKYGAPIGHATQDISAGYWVHTHNLATNLQQEPSYSYAPAVPPLLPAPQAAVFQGYLRPDGSVGTRNELWVIPTVGCVNGVVELLVQQARQQWAGYGIDNVVGFTHPFGCSQLGDDHRDTQRILANLVRHPNAGGVLVVGLGCENNNLAAFRQILGDIDERRVRFLQCQQVDNEHEEGMGLLAELADYAQQFCRQAVPLSRLCLGVKCGGSDAFSGLTANPLVGRIADRLLAEGGSVLLTEVPEMFGAEHLLLNRCHSRKVFDELVAIFHQYRHYYQQHGQSVYENPSPGNKEGGISTLEEKSLGCTQKAGHGQVTAALPYGAQVTTAGLSIIAGPGNDLVAVTALAAAGAQLILFTTGRGTPFGSPIPTIKIASNSVLALKKAHWIDFNAGELLTEDAIVDELLTLVIATASGQQTCQERTGQHGIAIWKNGVTL